MAGGLAHRLIRWEPMALLVPAGSPLANRPAVPLSALRDAGVRWLAGDHVTPEWETVARRLLRSCGAPVDGAVVLFASMTAVRLLGDAMRSRVRATRLVVSAGLTATAGHAAVLLAPAAGGAALAVAVALSGWALAGAGMALIWPVVSSAVGAAFPGRARRLAMVSTLSYGGGLIGPAVIGGVRRRFRCRPRW